MHERRALTAAVAFVVLAVALLSLPGRYAERYAVSATFVVSAVGAVAAQRTSPSLARDRRSRPDGPALPAVIWTVLAIGRLLLGPYLPRIEA